MKKILFAAFAVVAVSFASCGNQFKSNVTNDSTNVDTTHVDTTHVDSVHVDSLNTDSAVAK
jgi:putative lipoprotein